MAMRMQSDPAYKDMMDNLIVNDGNLVDDMIALQNGDMVGHVLENYDTSADYWKLMEDGSLEFDGDGWLKDSNGNQIKDGQGNPIGAAGIETGLLNILNGQTSGKGYNDFNGAQKILAQGLMEGAGIDSHHKDESKMGILNNFWDDKDNMGKAIRLDNGVYRDIYNDTRLYEHNTKYIYDTLVANGQMDVTHVGAHPTRDPGTQSGLLDGFDYISYEDYKANNFFAGDAYLQLQQPLNSESTSDYGYRIHPITGKRKFHGGTDFKAQEPTGFKPFADGAVSSIGYNKTLGNYVILENQVTSTFKGEEVTSSFYSVYAHLSTKETGGANTNFLIDDPVFTDDILAISGNTGDITGPHLHAATYFSYANDPLKNNPLAVLLNMEGAITFEYGNYYFNHNNYYHGSGR